MDASKCTTVYEVRYTVTKENADQPEPTLKTVFYPTLKEGLQNFIPAFKAYDETAAIFEVKLNGICNPAFACRLLNRWAYQSGSERVM